MSQGIYLGASDKAMSFKFLGERFVGKPNQITSAAHALFLFCIKDVDIAELMRKEADLYFLKEMPKGR